MGTLYLISTPIGNMQDISLRAIKTLFESDYIACEDTRRAGTLLETLSVPYAVLRNGQKPHHKPKFISYYEQNELRRIPEILSLLQQGMKVALISDAGTPAISDPGFKLIRECAVHKLKVESIPGPTSVITALTISGLPTDKFVFAGYPPQKPGHRMKFFEGLKQSIAATAMTVIFFEAPHKLIKTLETLQSVMGDIQIVMTRELTKIHEETRRESISEALTHFEKIPPRGEYVILFHL